MAHSRTQNAVFECSCGEDAEHPAGRSIADRLEQELGRGCDVKVIAKEPWRDAGWQIIVESKGAPFVIIVTALIGEENTWMLQVACRSDMGLIRQWLGGSFVDRSDIVYKISQAVANKLQEMGASKMFWKMDGVPSREDGSDVPVAPPS